MLLRRLSSGSCRILWVVQPDWHTHSSTQIALDVYSLVVLGIQQTAINKFVDIVIQD